MIITVEGALALDLFILGCKTVNRVPGPTTHLIFMFSAVIDELVGA